jgi:RimJ/RimL family protein N-acetyltransferase
VEIRTERLVLRQPRLNDLPALVTACQDLDIPRFIPFVPVPYGEDEARAFLEMTGRQWDALEERTFAVCEDHLFIGTVSIGLHEGGVVGYWLTPAARGHGLMTEAVAAAVRWVREAHGVRSLTLWTHPDNLASQAVAERVGFVRVGVGEHIPPFRDGTTVGVEFRLE